MHSPPVQTTKVGHLWGSWTSHLWIWGWESILRKKHINLVSTFVDIFKLSQQFLVDWPRDCWGISNFAFISRFWTDPCFTFSILWPCCYGGHLEPRKHLKKNGWLCHKHWGWIGGSRALNHRELVLVDSLAIPFFGTQRSLGCQHRHVGVGSLPTPCFLLVKDMNDISVYKCVRIIYVHYIYIYYICIYIQFKFPLHCKAWYQYLGLENKIKLLGKHETVQGW